jgi:hypothetical protein
MKRIVICIAALAFFYILPAQTPVLAVKPTATAITRIATAEELFLTSGTFFIRTLRDYRFLGIRMRQ